MSKSDRYTTHREVELLDTLRSFGGTARTTNLAAKLNVSEETIRRTIKALAKTGAVRRVHGGVYLSNATSEQTVDRRITRRTSEKTRIGATAAEFIPDGACVFLDVGSTTTFIAQALQDRRNLTVVTNSIHTAQSLAPAPGVRVFLAGGELRTIEAGTFGADTLAYVERFSFDIAVFTADGIGARGGFLLNNVEEAGLARTVASQSARVMMIADQSKLGLNAPVVSCPPSEVDLFVTDAPPRAPFQDLFADWEVDVIVAPEIPG